MRAKQTVVVFTNNKKISQVILSAIKDMKINLDTYSIDHSFGLDVLQKKETGYMMVDQDIEESFIDVLTVAKEKFPHIIRILMVSKWTQELILMSNRIVHLIIEKKALDEQITYLLQKAIRINLLLNDASLIKMVSTFDAMPSLKSVYLEILHHSQKSDSSLKKIGELVESDVVLSAKMLQIANLSIYAKTKRIADVKQAVNSLGLNLLRALIIQVHIFSRGTTSDHATSYLSSVEKHSTKVAKLSRQLAEYLEVDKQTQEESFIVGLLHDIGKFVLSKDAASYKAIEKVIKEKMVLPYQAEGEILNTTHAEIGAYLLGIWGFPLTTIEAVAYHHRPLTFEKKEITPITFVHVAEAMIQGEDFVDQETFKENLNLDYLEMLGIKHRVLAFFLDCVQAME
jgi:putative nucleotidyltransferase with HDIG domain